MLKIGQNWGKIAIYPSNAQQRSARLIGAFQLALQILRMWLFQKALKTCEM